MTLFKYLSSRNMKIDDKDKSELLRILYSAHSMKLYIRNVHVIRLMDGVNNGENNEDDNIVRKPSPMRTRSRKIKGDGVWFRW